jgi:hypothetical protein
LGKKVEERESGSGIFPGLFDVYKREEEGFLVCRREWSKNKMNEHSFAKTGGHGAWDLQKYWSRFGSDQ